MTFIVVDQAAIKNNLSLIICKRLNLQLKALKCVILDSISCYLRLLFLNSITNTWNKNIIQICKWKLLWLKNKWNHTPVNQIRAITLCCILFRNISKTAKYTLAGCCLLSCRTISRLYCINYRANLCLACLYIWEQLMNLIKCSCYLIICLTWTLSILTCFFCCTNLLSTSNILRILSGERKLSKTKRIRTE